jgi:hypothetical protein
MKRYARIQDGVVAELLATNGDIVAMFNPALIWIDVSSELEVAEGYSFDGTHFTPPLVPPAVASVPTIAELQARIAALAAELAALSNA